MARFTLLVVFVTGLVCLFDQARAMPLSPENSEIAQQIPNFPGPGEIPKPPGMLHSRVTRNAQHEIPGQDQFPPPPPPPQMPTTLPHRDADGLTVARGKREAKGTGGKLPMKAG